MGDRLPDDANTYRCEEPGVSIESRYWNFILDNFICSANEIYNHCITSQNNSHIREMVILTQNYSYDFSNLIEFINYRRQGFTVPCPRRNVSSYFGTDNDMMHVTPVAATTSPRKMVRHVKNEETLKKKRKGINVKAPEFIPANVENTNGDHTQNETVFYRRNEIHSLPPSQTPTLRLQEQPWAQVIPQVAQLTVPHFHIPFTNLVHYPVGNIVTHHLSQSYVGPYAFPTDIHSQNSIPERFDDEIESPHPKQNECAKHSQRVTHASIQVELSESEKIEADSLSTHTLINENITVVEDSVTIKQDLTKEDSKETPPLLPNQTAVKSTGFFDVQPTADAIPLVSSLEDNLNVDDVIFNVGGLQDSYSAFSETTEVRIEPKTSYKDILIAGLIKPKEIQNADNVANNVESSVHSGWRLVSRRKSNNVLHSGAISRTAHPQILSLPSIPEENLDDKDVNFKKKPLFKPIGNENNEDSFKSQSPNLTFNNVTPVKGYQKISSVAISSKVDTNSTKWREGLLKGAKKTGPVETFKVSIRPEGATLNLSNVNSKGSSGKSTESNNKSPQDNESHRNNFDTNVRRKSDSCTVQFHRQLSVSVKSMPETTKKVTRRKRFISGFTSTHDDDSNNHNISLHSTDLQEIDVSLNEDPSVDPFIVNEDDFDTHITCDDSSHNFTSDGINNTVGCLLDSGSRSYQDINDALSDDELCYNLPPGLTSASSNSLQDMFLREAAYDLDPLVFQIEVNGYNTSYTDLFLLFNDYFNSLPTTAQKEELELLFEMFNIEDIELERNPISIEDFENMCIRNPMAAVDLQSKITHKLRQIRETESKHQQAHEKRLQLLQCKTARVREQVQKVEEVKAAQHKLALERKSQIDLKLKKAEENRQLYLNIIRKKAHDEEEKLKEIAFINELEAQNRRHDSLALRQEHEGRLQCLIEERQRRLEEKAAKEAAVEERRRVLEAERQEKLEQMKEKRRQKEENIDRKQQEKEKERLVIAREKAREREERLQARQAAQLATVEELQKRIQQKQEESARRHEENIELIRQKAVHRNLVDDVANCSFYKCEETESLGSTSLDKSEANNKKRCKKIRNRLLRSANVFFEKYKLECPNAPYNIKSQLVRNMIDLNKYVENISEITDNASAIERILGDLKLHFEKQNEEDVIHIFIHLNGFQLFSNIIEAFKRAPLKNILPFKRIILKLCAVYNKIMQYKDDGLIYLIGFNVVMKLLDALTQTLNMVKNNSKKLAVFIEEFLNTCELALKGMGLIILNMNLIDSLTRSIITDTVSYSLNCGLTSKITEVFQLAVISEEGELLDIVPKCVLFFSALVVPSFRSEELIKTLKSSDCLGTISLLYEGLQKMNPSSKLPYYTMPVIDLLLSFAKLDVVGFQSTLGAEGLGLQTRAIASSLMTYCSVNSGYDDMLQLVIETVGYFAVHNRDNQSLIQSGQQPTILQQLANLPFQYFCDFHLKKILFPTLISCSHNNATNRAIVEEECSYQELETFVQIENLEDTIPLLKLFKNKDGEKN